MLKTGDWVVIAEGRRGFGSMGERYEVGQAEHVTAKTVRTVGRAHYRQTHAIDLVTVCADEEAAKLLCARLESARAELNRRISEATKAYRKTADELLSTPLSGES